MSDDSVMNEGQDAVPVSAVDAGAEQSPSSGFELFAPVSKIKWYLEFGDDSFTLRSADGESSRTVSRAQVPKDVQILPFRVQLLVIGRGFFQKQYELPDKTRSAFEAWRGPLTTRHLRHALSPRPILIIGVVFVLLSLTSAPSDPALLTNDPGSLDPASFDTGLFFAGVGAILFAAAAYFMPTKHLFIAEAGGLVLACVKLGHTTFVSPSPVQGIILAYLLLFSIGRLRILRAQYRVFKGFD